LGIDIRALNDANYREQLCRTIITALPEWFGIEEYNVKYAKEAGLMEGLVAAMDDDPVGLLVHQTVDDPHLGQSVLNIHWLGALPAHHRGGVGSALMAAVFDLARARDVDTVTVESLDPAAEYEPYLRTFSFYQKHGFEVYRHFCHDPEDPMIAMRRRI
jgi:GNAT superfamily N-acetyltransferase